MPFMGHVERLSNWRLWLEEDARHDETPPPTDEDVLGQYVYVEITEFIEERWDELVEALTNPDSVMSYEDLSVAWSKRD
jgi:hypothetical protein